MTKFDELVEMVSRQYENEVTAPPVPKEGWAEFIREYINETIEQRNGRIARRIKEQWREFFGETCTPITLVGFEEAMAKAEEDRLSSAIDYAPISDEAYDGEKVDHRHLDEFCILRDYRMGCDPYKESGEGSFTIFQEPSVLTQGQFDAEVQRLAGFFGKNLVDEK